MAEIYELHYGDYVTVENKRYVVWALDFIERTVGLVPIDLLDQYVHDLFDCYYQSKGKPITDISILPELRNDLLDDIEQYAKKNPVTEEIRSFYVNTLEDLYREQDLSGLKRKGYAYYGGNEVVACDWKKSEEALHLLFELENDAFVANSLGYIYYSDRLGAADYEKAFYYFSYAASQGVIEATYKLSDMYRKGHGTDKNPDKAWTLLFKLAENCSKGAKYKYKYPDIMLRIGYCYRDGVGVEKDLRKALKYFGEAREGILLRIKKHRGFGDEVVLKNVMKAIESIKNEGAH